MSVVRNCFEKLVLLSSSWPAQPSNRLIQLRQPMRVAPSKNIAFPAMNPFSICIFLQQIPSGKYVCLSNKIICLARFTAFLRHACILESVNRYFRIGMSKSSCADTCARWVWRPGRRLPYHQLKVLNFETDVLFYDKQYNVDWFETASG